mmetsp:Transcript_6852/g.17957  ORF Transcript_6852/g.17957 Transcript_6852/m.17957 type:complete len:285 (+) Transcript_6852:1222-2076(+)
MMAASSSATAAASALPSSGDTRDAGSVCASAASAFSPSRAGMSCGSAGAEIARRGSSARASARSTGVPPMDSQAEASSACAPRLESALSGCTATAPAALLLVEARAAPFPTPPSARTRVDSTSRRLGVFPTFFAASSDNARCARERFDASAVAEAPSAACQAPTQATGTAVGMVSASSMSADANRNSEGAQLRASTPVLAAPWGSRRACVGGCACSTRASVSAGSERLMVSTASALQSTRTRPHADRPTASSAAPLCCCVSSAAVPFLRRLATCSSAAPSLSPD